MKSLDSLLGEMIRVFAVAFFLMYPAMAASEAGNPDITEGSAREEIALLKLQLAVQQQQIDQLRREVDEQKNLLRLVTREASAAPDAQASAGSAKPARPTEVASLAPAVPVLTSGGAGASATATARQAPAVTEQPAPTSFSLGTVHITPVGFAEIVGYVRSRNVGSGLGTYYAGIPFSNTPSGNLSDANLTAQQSRLGLRLDTRVPGMGLLAYVETDFLGFSPGNVTVSTNSNAVRMRLFWFNLTRNKFEFLAGQSYSLITPNRRGVSPLPTDLFGTLILDPSNHVGQVWGRLPQVRFAYHPSSTVSVAASLEAPSQYAGGSAGAGVVTFPSALAASYSSQLNTGINAFNSPSPLPDFIGKLALDHPVGGRALHLEVSGMLRRFAVYNPLTQVSYGATGGGGSVNGNFDIVRNLRLFAGSFFSDGGGRYIYGMGPDLIARGDGSLSLVRAFATLDGFEALLGRHATLYGYYGGAYFQKNETLDPLTGQLVGYGYQGSPSNHNRTVQEATLGLSYLFWRSPAYGGLALNTQYSYVFRNPWAPVPGQPRDAHVSMLFLGLRYLLPGAPPGPK